MRKNFWQLGLSLTLIASTITFSASSASAVGDTSDLYSLGAQGDVSCPAPNTCTAIEGGEAFSIVAWEGSGDIWSTGTEIDFTGDPENAKILKDNDIRYVSPVALTCMSISQKNVPS